MQLASPFLPYRKTTRTFPLDAVILRLLLTYRSEAQNGTDAQHTCGFISFFLFFSSPTISSKTPLQTVAGRSSGHIIREHRPSHRVQELMPACQGQPCWNSFNNICSARNSFRTEHAKRERCSVTVCVFKEFYGVYNESRFDLIHLFILPVLSIIQSFLLCNT